MQMQLEQTTLGGIVHEVSVSVMHSALLEEKQRELFTTHTRGNKNALNHLINRLSGRLGYDRVVAPQLTSAKLPEQACYLQPLVGATGARSLGSRRAGRRDRHGSPRPKNQRRQGKNRAHMLAGDSQPASNTYTPFDRPLRLYLQPVELSAVSAAESGSPPALFCLRGKSYHVAHAWGPERIETQWWKGPCIRRDYFRIETTSGQQVWVYRDLQTRTWFLHGEFA
jgi:protein ImuB